MTSMVMPERSVAQRLAALEEANRVRSYRASVKREIAAGRLRVVDLLDDPDLQTMKLWDLLVSMPKLGRVKVSRIHSRFGISPYRTVGGLSERQRREVAAYLR